MATKQYTVQQGWTGAGPYSSGDVFEENSGNKEQIAHWLKMGAICEYDAEAEAAKNAAAQTEGEALLSADGHDHARAISDLRAQVAALEAKIASLGATGDTPTASQKAAQSGQAPNSPALTTGDDKIAEVSSEQAKAQAAANAKPGGK